jgi:hypothetical protein
VWLFQYKISVFLTFRNFFTRNFSGKIRKKVKTFYKSFSLSGKRFHSFFFPRRVTVWSFVSPHSHPSTPQPVRRPRIQRSVPIPSERARYCVVGVFHFLSSQWSPFSSFSGPLHLLCRSFKAYTSPNGQPGFYSGLLALSNSAVAQPPTPPRSSYPTYFRVNFEQPRTRCTVSSDRSRSEVAVSVEHLSLFASRCCLAEGCICYVL